MENNAITTLLTVVLAFMLILLVVLIIVYFILRSKANKKEKGIKNDKPENITSETQVKPKTSSNEYNKQSIFDFMEFDDIIDNMIEQKNGRRYVMVIECQGVNYDLMSSMEKVGVEEGFQQFLNTLRHPIQIYIQTRTINLEDSVNTYKEKVKAVENKYNQMVYKYNRMLEADTYSRQELDKYYFEITKQKNLYEYGKDIVANTEKMSLNKNVLNRKYYIVIPYYSEELGEEKYTKEEIRNIAFSELYTKSQSIIRTLSACSVAGKILSSNELVELLYMAYNRDDAETYGLDKAIKASYDSLYSTSYDIFEKKMKVLDKNINDRAIDLANTTIEKVKSKVQIEAEKKEGNMDELIRNLAQVILQENKEYVGIEIANQAIKEIKEEGDKKDEEVKKTTKGRKKQSVK